MIQKILVWFIHLGPNTKRWFWKAWYNLFARKSRDLNFQFMNYGYSSDGFHPHLSDRDEAERYPIHLYHHTVTQTNVKNKTVLEVGSGRGGGLSYIVRYLKPESAVGLDISKDAVLLCNDLYKKKNLSFVEGDSENLPFPKNTFDILLNIESSHCYGNLNIFLSEVCRVLKPRGVFLWCDFRTPKEMENLFNLFSQSELKKIKETNITPNIIAALDILSVSRKEKIITHVPRLIRDLFMTYAGIKGSSVYRAFHAGDLVYKSAAFQKLDKNN